MKDDSYNKIYDDLYSKIQRCPEEFTCVIQEYKKIEDNLKDGNSMLIAQHRSKLKKAYKNALEDAYNNGVINRDCYDLYIAFNDEII